MKPYLFAFLLFFLLLLHQSHFAKAAVVRPSFLSKINSAGRINKDLQKKIKYLKNSKKFIDAAKDYLEAYLKEKEKEKPNPPTPPNLPLNEERRLNEERKGFAPLKEYLSNFGYLPSSDSFNNTVDQQTLSAIKKFQESFNLPVTADILKLISLPRCAVPDMNFHYGFSQDVSWPKARHRWFRKTNLTYGFLPESEVEPNAIKVFKSAFTRWADATGFLNLTETTYDDADIKVGFYTFSDVLVGDLYGFSLITQNPQSNVKTAEIKLNDILFWALPSEKGDLSAKDGVLDLESAAMHQIGHLLGFDHSFMHDSIMYPYILPSQERKVELSDSDKNNIKKQYANR